MSNPISFSLQIFGDGGRIRPSSTIDGVRAKQASVALMTTSLTSAGLTFGGSGGQPAAATAVLGAAAPRKHHLLVGREHGRTIPLPDISGAASVSDHDGMFASPGRLN